MLKSIVGAALLAPLLALAQPVDFKGLSFGTSAEDMRRHLLDVGILTRWDCRSEAKVDASWCDADGLTYANHKTTRATFVYRNDKLASVFIEIPTKGFADAVDALTERYGKPTVVGRTKITTLGGAALEQVRYAWTPKAGGHVSATNHSSDNVLIAQFHLHSPEGLAALMATPKPKKDI